MHEPATPLQRPQPRRRGAGESAQPELASVSTRSFLCLLPPAVDWLGMDDLLLAWFAVHRRDLPWRGTRDPYAILVSEVMLQQTQVERVKPRYLAWLERWPSVGGLAAAPAGDVIREWQ